MASWDSSMPPSTHCSAAMSCGGARSNSGSCGGNSATLTLPTPCRLRAPARMRAPHMYGAGLTVLPRRGTGAKRTVDHLVDGLCNTPGGVCTSWGHPGDNRVRDRTKSGLTCENFVHHCGEKKVADLLRL